MVSNGVHLLRISLVNGRGRTFFTPDYCGLPRIDCEKFEEVATHAPPNPVLCFGYRCRPLLIPNPLPRVFRSWFWVWICAHPLRLLPLPVSPTGRLLAEASACLYFSFALFLIFSDIFVVTMRPTYEVA